MKQVPTPKFKARTKQTMLVGVKLNIKFSRGKFCSKIKNSQCKLGHEQRTGYLEKTTECLETDSAVIYSGTNLRVINDKSVFQVPV